jgi:hypothetical protein
VTQPLAKGDLARTWRINVQNPPGPLYKGEDYIAVLGRDNEMDRINRLCRKQFYNIPSIL